LFGIIDFSPPAGGLDFRFLDLPAPARRQAWAGRLLCRVFFNFKKIKALTNKFGRGFCFRLGGILLI